MSLVSKCPRCHELVTIPDGLGPEAEVRCPLCVVVYPLREALAKVPPALIPVDTGAITGPHPGSDALAQSDLITEQFHVPGADDVALQLDDVSGPPKAETESAAVEAYGLEDWPQVDAAPAIDTGTAEGTSPAIDTGQTPADADALAAFGGGAADREYEPVAGRQATRPLRRKQEKGAVRFLIEVFLGGVVGLTIGYYVLCWVLGPRHGLPKLPLPLLPHTMHWFRGAEKPDDATGQPSAGEPDTPKRHPTGQPQSAPPGPKENEPVQPGVPPHEPPPERAEPQPQQLPEGYVGPRAPPSFTSDELGKALKAAHDALGGVAAAGEMTAKVYAEFCRLGHVLTFVRGDPGDGRLTSRKLAVRDLLKKIGDRPGGTGQIGRLAGALLENRSRSQGGVLLAGTAGRVGSQDQLHGTVVTLAVSGSSVSILSDRPLPFAESDLVMILGSIVDNPAENLVGYHGTKSLVVWVGAAVKLAP